MGRVAVIGAGPSGLAAIKNCKSYGLDVVCYERSSVLGGLWYYREQVEQGISSVARMTVINTSKASFSFVTRHLTHANIYPNQEYSGYSDFPPPADFPNYMHRTYMMYAEKFNLEKCIQFNRKVVDVTYAEDHESTGRWKVTVQHEQDHQKRETNVFDGVVIATGHHVIPLVPKFKDDHLFKGRIMHTHEFKHSQAHSGQRVLVVGIGNSGADTVAELSTCAKVVYLATRRGCWIRSRVGFRGWPIDNYLATRAFRWVTSFLPRSWVDTCLEGYLNLFMDHELFGLKPKHRISQQHPTVSDSFAQAMLAGRIALRRNIDRFTEEGVIFEGESQVTPLDTVILATGYKLQFPFVDASIISPNNNEVSLFKNMFSPLLRHAHTLALVGLVQPLGPIHVTAELQARYFASLMVGETRLPSKDEMKKVIEQDKNYIKSIFYESPRHAVEIDYMRYCDEIASFIGCKPNLWKIAVTDPTLWMHLWFGLFTVYQYRLEGPHKWQGARETIVKTNDRIRAALQLKYRRLAESAHLLLETEKTAQT